MYDNLKLRRVTRGGIIFNSKIYDSPSIDKLRGDNQIYLIKESYNDSIEVFRKTGKSLVQVGYAYLVKEVSA